MKILLFGPVYPYRGGIAHFTTSLALNLADRGHTVDVISFKRQYPKFLYPGKSDKDPSEGREQVPAAYLLNPMSPLSWRVTLKAILDDRPDRVIFQWWTTFLAPAYHWIFKRLVRAGVPLTVIVHNALPHEQRTMDRLLARYALKHASDFLVMNPAEKDKLLSLLTPASPRVQLVPHPVYQLFPPSGKSRQQIRKELGLPLEHPVLLFFGFIRPYKGLTVLLDAMGKLKAEGHPAHLLVAGETWGGRREYDQQIASLGIGDRTHLYLDYIPDAQVAQFFEAAEIFVAPYTSGTQSGSIKTALGFGLPLVVTDVIADDILRCMPGECVIIPSGDAAALTEGIRQALSFTPSGGTAENLGRKSWDALIHALVED